MKSDIGIHIILVTFSRKPRDVLRKSIGQDGKVSNKEENYREGIDKG